LRWRYPSTGTYETFSTAVANGVVYWGDGTNVYTVYTLNATRTAPVNVKKR
jgi:hypothetical protein